MGRENISSDNEMAKSNVLKEELVNENSFLQLIKTNYDKISLRCSYIDQEDNSIKKDVIHEFTEENKNLKSVFQIEGHIIVMDDETKQIGKIYNMEYHYFVRGTQCCTSYYEKQIKDNEATHITVEPHNATPVFRKTYLQKK